MALRAPLLRTVTGRLPGTPAAWGPPRGVAAGQSFGERFLALPGPEPFIETHAQVLGATLAAVADRPVYPDLILAGEVRGVIVDGRTGAVIDADGRLLPKLSTYCRRSRAPAPWDHPVFSDWGRKRQVVCPGAWVLLQSPQSGVYYHWLLEVLPRLAVLESVGLMPSGFRCLVPPLRPFHEQTLQAAGITSDRWQVCAPDTRYLCERLLSTSDLCPQGGVERLAPWLRAALRGDTADTPADELLYITRKDAGLRDVPNEGDIVAVVKRFGGRTVSLDELPVREQARLFAGARCLVTAHGSALANLVFCRPGTAIVELAAPAYVRLLYARMATRLGLRYWILVGEGPREEAGRPGLYMPVLVSAGSLQSVLARILGA